MTNIAQAAYLLMSQPAPAYRCGKANEGEAYGNLIQVNPARRAVVIKLLPVLRNQSQSEVIIFVKLINK
ncbi:MAG: hypothetical protein LBC81_02890 [Tannerellaceae bacterium]|nr:hypothetical protein [Tannerellaceae bacterium]